ncbi:MAG: hypothetical protein Q4615_06355 [Paracoccus aminovorans]|nr:hypothetical protein [Paracoccus aminovorans]
MTEQRDEYDAAVQTILDAGCAGPSSLAWAFIWASTGTKPDFAPGDAWHDAPDVVHAMTEALKLLLNPHGTPAVPHARGVTS